MSKELSHDLLKKLYIQKMQAIEKKDKAFLDKLQQQHPELFDKRFLYQMLQKELDITSQELPAQLDKLLQEIIKSHPKTH
jgi:HD superfamily phosphohydrolase YqeK